MWAQSSSRGGGGPSKITSAPTCMWEACFSWWRKEASIALRRSLCGPASPCPDSTRHNRQREAAGNGARRAGRAGSHPGRAGGHRQRALRRRRGRPAGRAATSIASTPRPPTACSVAQVELGPRPAGSEASRQLAETLRRLLPRGRFQAVPGGLRNVVGTVPGREPGYIVVGAHYDTKDIPGFVGANDGASGTAVVTELARTIKRPKHTIQFVLFDGEEAPGRGSDDFSTARAARLARGGAALSRRTRDGAARLRGRQAPADPARGELETGALAAPAPLRPRRWGRGATSRMPPRRGCRTTTSRSCAWACPRST